MLNAMFFSKYFLLRVTLNRKNKTKVSIIYFLKGLSCRNKYLYPPPPPIHCNPIVLFYISVKDATTNA